MLESGGSSASAAGDLSLLCALVSPDTTLSTHTEFCMREIESEATIAQRLSNVFNKFRSRIDEHLPQL